MTQRRTRIKICGVTCVEDLRNIVHTGADAVGFVFAPGSSRCLADGEELDELLNAVPGFVDRVAVCLHSSQVPARLLSCFDVVQTYDLDDPILQDPSGRAIPAIRMRDIEDASRVEAAVKRLQPRAILLDAYVAGKDGGAGVAFDWNLATIAMERISCPIILAGGLNPSNVGTAISQVGPYAVDVSSGVEMDGAPRRKDPKRVEEFVAAVLRADMEMDKERL